MGAIAHLYRGEVYRSTIWRTRLDNTTNWAIVTMGIALSKQLCGKVMGAALWRLDDISKHWDQIMIRSHATIGGQRVVYQEGPLAAMRHPDDLIARYGTALKPNTIMFCGTLGAKGGIRPAARFEMELDDPVLKRRMTHGYDVVDLPVIT